MTEYKEIFDYFKDKITDYDLPLYDEITQNEIMLSFMKTACSKFKRICKVDLSDRDDIAMHFNNVLDDEIKDIITEWMVEGWVKQFLNNSENLRNKLSTKDFSVFSPANLLDKIKDTYELSRKRAKSTMNEYSFINGDLENLKT